MFRHSRGKLMLVAALLIGAAGCAPRQGANTRLFKQWNAKCKEAADLVATVKDVPTAKAAAPKIAAAIRELDEISGTLEDSYDPTEVDFRDAPRVDKQVGEGIVEMQRLMTESLRVGKDPEMKAALGDAWNLLPVADMMEAGVEFPPIE